MRPRAKWAMLAALGLLALLSIAAAPAGAAFNPGFEVNLSNGPNGGMKALADSVPQFETVLTNTYNDDGSDFINLRRIKMTFPPGWKVNNVEPDSDNPITHCQLETEPNGGEFLIASEDDATKNNCPDDSIVGRVETTLKDLIHSNDTMLGRGHIYLMETDENNEPVKLGVYMAIDHSTIGLITFILVGDVTLEGRLGQERIVADFPIPAELVIYNIRFLLTNDKARGLIRTPINCGAMRFDALLSGATNVNSNVIAETATRSATSRIDADCNVRNPITPRYFEPFFTVKADEGMAPRAGRPSDLTVKIRGKMNNGDRLYQSLGGLSLRLPEGMAGSAFPFANGERCPANAEWMVEGQRETRPNTCSDFDVGDVKATVMAAQDTHRVSGDIYIADSPRERGTGSRLGLGNLKFVFKDLPNRLNIDDDFSSKDVLVVEGRLGLNAETNRVEATISRLPTTYEIRDITARLDGTPPGSVRPLLINPTHCDSGNIFSGLFAGDRGTTYLTGQDPPEYPVTDCYLNFAPFFRYETLSDEERAPGQPTKPRLVIAQDHAHQRQAYTRVAEYLFDRSLRVNSQLDGIVPCEARTPADCGWRSIIGHIRATSHMLESEGRYDNYVQGPLHLMRTEPGKRFKVATELTHDKLDVSVTQEATIGARRDGEGKFYIATSQTQPNLPIDDIRITLTQGLLRNPWTCGASLLSGAEFGSYAGDSYSTQSAPVHLGPCGAELPGYRPQLMFEPSTYRAGSAADLNLGMSRPSQDQATRTLKMTLPRGWGSDVLTKPVCSEAQAQDSQCPDQSQIGSVKVTANIFKFLEPLVIDGGKLFNCQPSGDDAGAVCIDITLPEIAGGGHLTLKGQVLVTDNANKITIAVDGVPTEFDIAIDLNVMGNTTPTYCTQNPAEGSFTGELGVQASASTPYASSDCDSLNFSPKLDVQHSSHKVSEPTAITTTITNSEEDAAMESVELHFPKGASVELTKLAVCKRDQRASCPENTRLATVEVWTPYLPEPLTGDLYFIEGGEAYIKLRGRVPVDLHGKITVSASKGLTFKLDGIPPLAVTKTIVRVAPGLMKNQRECGSAIYTATFKSHSGKVSTSRSSVAICGKKKAGGPTFNLKAKLKPKRANAFTNATFTLSQKGEEVGAVRSLKIGLGKGKRTLRIVKPALRRKAKATGQVTLKPKGGKKQRAKLTLRRGKLRLRGVKGLKLKLKGRTLMLNGLPKRKYKRIVIKINGRRGRLLRNPKRPGTVSFTGSVRLNDGTSTKVAARARVLKQDRR